MSCPLSAKRPLRLAVRVLAQASAGKSAARRLKLAGQKPSRRGDERKTRKQQKAGERQRQHLQAGRVARVVDQIPPSWSPVPRKHGNERLPQGRAKAERSAR